MATGRIQSFESFSTMDGPGIRFVVFMQGCPMRCLYCHNPETWDMKGGDEYTAEKVAKKIIKYKSYFKDGGGVTLSGGEPLMQPEFIIELFALLHEEGIHTAIDTSGVTFDPDDEENIALHRRVLENTDLVLLDIKHMGEDEHRTLTGHGNKDILSFAQFLSDEGKDMWIRHVLVPGITDGEASLIRLRNFIDTLRTVKKREILPYHTMGEAKYKALGHDYALKHVRKPERDNIQIAWDILNRKDKDALREELEEWHEKQRKKVSARR